MPTTRVVLVDDHEMVVESFRRVLAETDDIDVVAVALTGADAVTAVTAFEPDVVVLDYRLPDENGTVVARRIASRLPQTRILMLTGSGEDALSATLDAGCIGYLRKTEALDKLAGAIRSAAAGEAVISSEDLRRVLSTRESVAGRGADLNSRELEVLSLMADGLPNADIAEQLAVSVDAVRAEAQVILAKLGADSKLGAVAIARRKGLLSLSENPVPPP